MVDTRCPSRKTHPETDAIYSGDDRLLAGLVAGEPAAQAAFVRRFRHRVYGVTTAVLGDGPQAEAVAGDALSQAILNPTTYDSAGGSLLVWVLRLARDHARQRAGRHAAPAPGGYSDEAMTSGNGSSALRSALRRIPREQRKAVVLAAMYGYTAQEIADLQAIPLDTAKAHIRSGLTTLRGLLPALAAPSIDTH